MWDSAKKISSHKTYQENDVNTVNHTGSARDKYYRCIVLGSYMRYLVTGVSWSVTGVLSYDVTGVVSRDVTGVVS